MESLQKLEFGTVVISIHEGNITQIETTEKVRFALEKKKRHFPTKRWDDGRRYSGYRFPRFSYDTNAGIWISSKCRICL